MQYKTPEEEEARRLVLDFFEGNNEKASIWWIMPNPLLGNFSPEQMTKAGREKKLLTIIKQRLEGLMP